MLILNNRFSSGKLLKKLSKLATYGEKTRNRKLVITFSVVIQTLRTLLIIMPILLEKEINIILLTC